MTSLEERRLWLASIADLGVWGGRGTCCCPWLTALNGPLMARAWGPFVQLKAGPEGQLVWADRMLRTFVVSSIGRRPIRSKFAGACSPPFPSPWPQLAPGRGCQGSSEARSRQRRREAPLRPAARC
jgi:hypothetical protein